MCSGVILAHYNLCPLGSSDSYASASLVAGTTGMCHHTRPIFVFLGAMGFYCVGQAGFELLASSNPPTLTSQHAGIIGVSHHTQLELQALSNNWILHELREQGGTRYCVEGTKPSVTDLLP